MTFDHEQLQNAHTIIAVGERLGASQRDIQIALMTAMQESSLQNLSGGDRDSVGLFQQRDAWGTFEQRHNPATAAAMFFQGGHEGQRGLFDFSDRNSMSLSEAAQAVQVSAYPDAYAKWDTDAAQILQHADGLPPAAGDPGTGAGADPFAPDKGTHVAATDQDHDGLTDEFERLLGTDPTKADTDGDGVSDYVETTITHTDPLVADDQHGTRLVAAHDGGTPHDARIPMAALKAGFGGGSTLDSDHDGLSDLTEVHDGTDPYNADTDHDGVSDGIEHRLGSNPLTMDSDHDGIVDGVEYDHGTLTGPDDPGVDSLVDQDPGLGH